MSKNQKPLLNGDEGRNESGKFVAGNKYAKGNPFAKRVNQLRSALFDEATPADLRKILRTMIELAKSGSLDASEFVFDRLMGKPTQGEVLERLEQLEALLGFSAEESEEI